ncbi:MAG: hypothetical protein ACRDVM_00400 [Acidimicrobiia bacterium]
MRRLVELVVVAVLLPALGATAAEEIVCWYEQRPHPVYGETQTVTVCKIAGVEVEFGDEGEVPDVLFPAVGTDVSGECWYWTSGESQWVILERFPDGSATLGYDPDGVPGGPLVVDTTAPACTSEPTPEEPDEVTAWNLIREYVHQLPDPELNPPVPWGLAGLDTHLGVVPPEPFAASVVSPGTGTLLEVEAWVAGLAVGWGDGQLDTFPPEVFHRLTGYPDGLAWHVYEAKTCTPPGEGARCHPTLSAYPLEVSYVWAARWRVGAGDWRTLAVPDTTTSVDYPVVEVISVLTDAG